MSGAYGIQVNTGVPGVMLMPIQQQRLEAAFRAVAERTLPNGHSVADASLECIGDERLLTVKIAVVTP